MKLQLPIYLDYMATTPVDPVVAEVMSACLEKEGVFGNPASRTHRYGYEADECVRKAREEVAALINADPREIIWTSGATESDNLAIKGAAYFYQRQGKHIITMSTEHKAVLDTCRYLETKGFEVTYLDPEANGVLNLAKLKAAIRPDTILVSIMHVNNETGVIQDIAAIADIVHQSGAIFHSDAAQSAGKAAIDVRAVKIDLMSFSGHKVYGPKGIGALFVSRSPRIRLEPQMHGGAHQDGLRSGTLPTQQIAGMGTAFRIAKEQFDENHQKIKAKRDRFWKVISALPGIHLNGDEMSAVPNCLNVSVEGVEAESLIIELADIAISSGSACNSANPEPSHVLTAMGLSRDAANRSIRISFGRFTTDDEVDYASQYFCERVNRLRERSPLWDTAQQKALQKSRQ
ncbi:MAG: IscS subfamily cysteine desulfurase [Coxiellaceae bacterium]|nr:IscS subfamily cysteine desulfurase [Coxiellaceae bacterium]